MPKRKPEDIAADDLRAVSERLNTTEDRVFFDVKQEPIGVFDEHLEALCGDFVESGTDFKRSYYIAKLIERGADPEPVYVINNAGELVIVKGQHRLVAFWILGLKFVPVAYVVKKG